MNEIQRAQGQLVEELERLRRRVDGLRRTKHERVPSVGGLNGCDDGYRALFLNHAVGILVAEADGEGYIYANPAICRMLGYTEEQLRQNGLLHIYPKNAWQHVMSEFKAQERGEKTMAVDIPCLRRDGSTIYVDIGKSRVLIEGRECDVGFFVDVSERRRATEELSIRTHELGERLKELNCLYEIFRLIEKPGISLEGICHRMVNLIVTAMQHPEVAGVRIFLGDKEFRTEEFRETPWRLVTDILVRGKEAGSLEVVYLEERPQSDLGPFMREEKDLLDALAERLGRIAQSKQTEEALLVENAHLEALIESAQEAIVLTDNKGRVLRTNSEFTRLFGYTQEEALGCFVDDLVAPNLKHREAEELTKRVSNRESVSLESVRWRKDGTSVDVSILGSPIKTPTGQVGVYAVYRDITERRRAEETLKRKALQQDELLRTARHLTESLDLKQVLTRIGTGAKEMLKAHGCVIYLLEKDGASLTPVVAIDPQYEQEILSTSLDVEGSLTGKAIEARRGLIFNDPLSSSSGKQIPGTPEEEDERIIVAPFIVDDAVLGAMCIDRMKLPYTEEDLALAEAFANYASTALKNAQMFNDLQREVKERRRMERKLKQTMAELERSNAELQQFAYVASHDLQEPLRMVASYVQLLGKRYQGKLDPDADDFITFAVDGASRMQGLINDLLAYSRVGTRGRPFEPTDLTDVFDRAVANLQAAIVESNAVVEHGPLPTLMGDRVQLIQLFQNLIGNGIKFHNVKPPHIHVSVEKRENEWVVSINDNGIGIDPEYADRIFLIFQRLHSRSEYKGTGIGLAICKKIVERHRGRIWVESQPGKGSTFYFTIPWKGEEQS